MKVLNLVTNEKAEFYRQQIEVLEGRGVEETTLPVPKHRVGTDGPNERTLLDYLRYVPGVLRHSLDSYDLVHANNGLTGPFALAQPSLPVVISLWGSDLFGRYGRVSRFCARHADGVMVMSEHMAEELEVGARVVPHGVDLDLFRPMDRELAREELGWDPDRYHVLFPYRPWREIKDYPRAERVVEGARELVDDPVELHALDGVDHDEMPTYMNAANVVLVTSKREGFPNVVKEALACNVPVVTTDVGDLSSRLAPVSPSVVSGDDDRLAEGLAGILDGPCRSNGRPVARDVSLSAMGDGIYEVYESVLR